jgi:hypothetical protein
MLTPLYMSVEDIWEIGVARENGVGSEHTPREAAVFRPFRDRFARPLRKPCQRAFCTRGGDDLPTVRASP